MNGDVSELISIIDAMPFACAVVDERFHIKHLNTEMSEFLGFSKKAIPIDVLFTTLLQKDEAASFSDFIRSSHSGNGGNSWQIFRFKGKQGECHQLMLSKLKERDGINLDRFFILLGIPMTNIHLDTALEASNDQENQNKMLSNKYQNIFSLAVNIQHWLTWNRP